MVRRNATHVWWRFLKNKTSTTYRLRRRRPSRRGGTVARSVTVRNDNWLDVVIYAVRGSARFRVGTVGGSSTQTFRLPAQAISGGSEVQILADPIGATRGYVTDPVVLGPGQRLELQVGSPISISTFAIRNE